MVTIDYGNSYCRVTGLKTEAFKRLSKAISYMQDESAAFFSGAWKPRRISLLGKRGDFPTGLLERVWSFMEGEGHKMMLKGFKAPELLPRVGLPEGLEHAPYSAQLEAMKAAELMRRGIISMPTGTGKSIVIAMIVYRLNVRTLIVVPTVELKKQLDETLTKVLGSVNNVVVENIDSPDLEKLTDFDCLIIDEAHHVAAKTYHRLNRKAWKGIFYRFFLTATPYRNQKNEQLLFEAIAGRCIFKLSYKDAIKRGYIVPVEAYYVDLPKQDVQGFTWNEVYKELVTTHNDRNELLVDLLTSLRNQDKKVLCLVKELQHGHDLAHRGKLAFANGKDDDTRDFIRQFNNGGIMALIGTTGILGEGVDTKPCEYVIIAGLGKAKSAFLQQVGRGVRRYPRKDSCKVILFRDSSHKYLLRHFNAQCTILKEEFGIKPVKLEI